MRAKAVRVGSVSDSVTVTSIRFLIPIHCTWHQRSAIDIRWLIVDMSNYALGNLKLPRDIAASNPSYLIIIPQSHYIHDLQVFLHADRFPVPTLHIRSKPEWFPDHSQLGFTGYYTSPRIPRRRLFEKVWAYHDASQRRLDDHLEDNENLKLCRYHSTCCLAFDECKTVFPGMIPHLWVVVVEAVKVNSPHDGSLNTTQV